MQISLLVDLLHELPHGGALGVRMLPELLGDGIRRHDAFFCAFVLCPFLFCSKHNRLDDCHSCDPTVYGEVLHIYDRADEPSWVGKDSTIRH